LIPSDTSQVEIYLKSCPACAPQRLAASTLSFSAVSPYQLQVTTQLSLPGGNTYQLIVFGSDAAGNRTQPPFTLALKVLPDAQTVTLRTYPNPVATKVTFELILNTNELPLDARLWISNVMGVPILDTPISVMSGTNMLRWAGPERGAAPGLYLYSLELRWKDGRNTYHKGKIRWQP
jgi:hypothetical protein